MAFNGTYLFLNIVGMFIMYYLVPEAAIVLLLNNVVDDNPRFVHLFYKFYGVISITFVIYTIHEFKSNNVSLN